MVVVGVEVGLEVEVEVEVEVEDVEEVVEVVEVVEEVVVVAAVAVQTPKATASPLRHIFIHTHSPVWSRKAKTIRSPAFGRSSCRSSEKSCDLRLATSREVGFRVEARQITPARPQTPTSKPAVRSGRGGIRVAVSCAARPVALELAQRIRIKGFRVGVYGEPTCFKSAVG